jgi:hypothetical protein
VVTDLRKGVIRLDDARSFAFDFVTPFGSDAARNHRGKAEIRADEFDRPPGRQLDAEHEGDPDDAAPAG